MDNPANRGAVAFAFFVIAMVAFAYLSHRSAEGQPTNLTRFFSWFTARYLVRYDDDEAEPVRDPVHVPVAEPQPNQYAAAAKLDITKPMTQEELIRLLCYQINPADGKQFSANKIAEFIGGTRADVLAIVREVRSGEKPLPYQAEPVTPRQMEQVRTLPDGKWVRRDQWGNEWVQVDNQMQPAAIYEANLAAA